MTAAQKVMAARTALVLDQPFFGALALRLKMVEDPTCKTAWVDGVSLGYNPAFVADLTHAELVAVFVHEVMHCAAGHPWRRDEREHGRWNEGCDRAINPMLRTAGFTLPEGALFELAPDHLGMSAEWITDRLPKGAPKSKPGKQDQAPDQGGQGAPQDGPGEQDGGEPDDSPGDPLGEVRDAPEDAAAEAASEDDWKLAVQQAANMAKARGNLPGALERFAKDAATARVDWRSVLRRFVQAQARADYSWRTPNTRYLARGIYLPALRSEAMGPLVVAIDTSGSIDDVLLAQFAGEIQAIIEELQPERVHVMYADARVNLHETIEKGEPFVATPNIGGGGTHFGPVFEALAELDEQPVCLVYLTDLDGGFPAIHPDVPVLWASTSNREAPFGEVVKVS